ncbi:unnamed protein product [Spodoptera exigua]|nr:unnamed protein product [Spodoptera exigua]
MKCELCFIVKTSKERAFCSSGK